MTSALELQRVYTRSDPRGRFRFRESVAEPDCNRLAAFWRPLVDLTDSDFSSLRLRMLGPVANWLAEPTPGRRSWFSMIGIPGLRHQVLRHAGLRDYDCREPAGLAPELRTARWQTLVERIDAFADLDDGLRALVVFHLAQLSYSHLAVELAGGVELTGDPLRDHYAYEVARVHARLSGGVPRALALFEELARSSRESLVALGSCFQGIGHALRQRDRGAAVLFEQRGADLAAAAELDHRHGWLVGSRYHRAVALLRLAEGRVEESKREARSALELHERLAAGAVEEPERLVVDENRLYVLELEIEIALRHARDELRPLLETLVALDPYCVEARLRAGDGFVALGDPAEAARWYSLAGELATGSGAVGWFRAAQCYETLGDRGRAANAMGRCLELDDTAVEPRTYLAQGVGR
jgi:hypothetical protein